MAEGCGGAWGVGPFTAEVQGTWVLALHSLHPGPWSTSEAYLLCEDFQGFLPTLATHRPWIRPGSLQSFVQPCATW